MDTQLITQIARCDEVEKAKTDLNHPCNKIVTYQQKELGITDFQLPEPWNGDISKAKILFISSNPSIDPLANQNGHEEYPTCKGVNDNLPEFYKTRFNEYNHFKPNSYWYDANRILGWILNTDYKTFNLLKGRAALTEVVHCKSKNESGVANCCCYCTNKWLDKVLAEFNGKYIIVIGKTARNCFSVRNTRQIQVAFVPRARTASSEKRKALLFEQIPNLQEDLL